MSKLIATFAAIVLSQIISAQSLTPTAIVSAASLSVKSSPRLTASVGEITLRSMGQPALAKNKPVAKGEESAIMEVYPNPAVGFVSFNFKMAGKGQVSLSLTNSMGQKLTDLFTGNYDNGKISEQMDISKYAAGIYFLTLQYTDTEGKQHQLSKKFQVM